MCSAYFNFRIERLSTRLKEQQEERAQTIQKLKDATKYDSTMELIEKYGGVEGNPGSGKKKNAASEAGDGEVESKDGDRPRNKKGRQSQGVPGRTSMGPPPTANIQRRPDGSHMAPQPPPDPSSMEPGAEFAPNAEYTHPSPQSHHSYPLPQQQAPALDPETHWYDRIFDVLLGEDETAPKNRIVLICRSCRLVNGQARPGAKSLAEVGTWRCMACGATNGEIAEDEGQRIVREVLGEKGIAAEGEPAVAESQDASESSDDDTAEAADGPAASVKKYQGKSAK